MKTNANIRFLEGIDEFDDCTSRFPLFHASETEQKRHSTACASDTRPPAQAPLTPCPNRSSSLHRTTSRRTSLLPEKWQFAKIRMVGVWWRSIQTREVQWQSIKTTLGVWSTARPSWSKGDGPTTCQGWHVSFENTISQMPPCTSKSKLPFQHRRHGPFTLLPTAWDCGMEHVLLQGVEWSCWHTLSGKRLEMIN